MIKFPNSGSATEKRWVYTFPLVLAAAMGYAGGYLSNSSSYESLQSRRAHSNRGEAVNINMSDNANNMRIRVGQGDTDLFEISIPYEAKRPEIKVVDLQR